MRKTTTASAAHCLFDARHACGLDQFDKEILIVEGHLLVAYNVATGTRRKSNIRVEDAALVFLR